VGALALQKNVAGISNTAIGHGSLAEVIGNGAISGSYNTAIGSYSQASNVSGKENVSVGVSALNVNNSGNYNVAIGNYSLGGCTGSENLEIRSGNSPAFNITTQSNYISLGSSSSTMAYIKIAWTITSDARDKMNFGDVPHGLEFVTKLKPVSYQHKLSREEEVAHGPVRYGFLAQDILELEPDDSVIIDANDPESLRLTESNLFAVLVKAIQELKSEFDAYKASHP
jgi:trimeric autotransporter adhesin